MSTIGYEDYGFTPHYCRAWSWSAETQAVLDGATTVAELRAAWTELEAEGKVDAFGGSEWHHALAHLDNETVRQSIIQRTQGVLSGVRDEDEINAVAEEFFDRVWYYRSTRGDEPKTVPGACMEVMHARQKVEDVYGKDTLTGLSEFDLGMISGKLSALRWVLGHEWDFLDT